jgi:hypothetical protein
MAPRRYCDLLKEHRGRWCWKNWDVVHRENRIGGLRTSSDFREELVLLSSRIAIAECSRWWIRLQNWADILVVHSHWQDDTGSRRPSETARTVVYSFPKTYTWTSWSVKVFYFEPFLWQKYTSHHAVFTSSSSGKDCCYITWELAETAWPKIEFHVGHDEKTKLGRCPTKISDGSLLYFFLFLISINTKILPLLL